MLIIICLYDIKKKKIEIMFHHFNVDSDDAASVQTIPRDDTKKTKYREYIVVRESELCASSNLIVYRYKKIDEKKYRYSE